MKDEQVKSNGMNNKDKKSGKSRKRKKIAITLLSVFLILPVLIGGIGIGAFALWADSQKLDKSLLPTAQAVPVFFDALGNEIPYEESDYIQPSEVSDNLKNAFVALEDKRFYKHKGYDVIRIGGALFSNLKAGKIKEGASTITQQLVKNTHLSNERTLSRKLKELAIATKVEKEYSKDEILSMYLSVIYFGNGCYGVKQAARTYFGKSPAELSLAECAALAGIVRNPQKYSPKNNPENCVKRRNLVLSLMKDEKYIRESEYESAVSEPLAAAKVETDTRNFERYLSEVKKEVCEVLGITKYQLSNSGLKIYTGLNPSLQSALENQEKNSNNIENDKIGSVSIIIDNESGIVSAFSSTYPYEIYRQAGSVLKPLAVYAPSVEQGIISLATPVVDEKIDYGGYSPSNFGGIYYGETTVREAIKKSMNSISVKVMDYLGTKNSVRTLNALGIDVSAKDENYALALGATLKGVTPLSIAGGYSTLARGGEYVKPSFVRYIVKDDGKIYTGEARQKSRVFSEATSWLMTNALSDTVRDGTAKTLSTLDFEVAAKTGTAQKNKDYNSDAWCASYNNEYTVVVWHGNDEGITEKGGGYPTHHAARIWRDIEERETLSKCFGVCPEVEQADIDVYSSKKLKTVVGASENTPLEYRKSEFFTKNTLPDPSQSKFDKIEPGSLELSVSSGIVSISFDSEEIYSYELIRTDVLGSKVIFEGTGSEKIFLSDMPIGFGTKVEYVLICHLIGNEEIAASCSKSIFVDAANDFNLLI